MARTGAFALAATGAALLGAGFGVGLLVAGGAPREERIVTVERPAPAAVSPVPAPAAEKPAVPAPAAAPSPAASPLSESDRDALRALLARIPDIEIPSGEGAITGRVRSEDGRPLAGVEITIQPEWRNPKPAPPVPPGTTPPDPDPVDQAVASVQNMRWWRNSKRTTTSDASGEFRFDGLADAKHRLGGKLKGWLIQPKDHRSAYEAKPGAVVEFFATPSVEVRVEITMPDGTAADRAMVGFKSGTGNTSMGVHPQNPVVQVKPGEYEATAFAGDQQEWRSDPQQVSIPQDGEPLVLRFTLRGKPGVRGRLVFPEGEEMEGSVQVLLLRLSGDRKPDAAALKAGGTSTHTQGRHQGFKFQFTDIAPGRYALGATRGQGGPVVVVEEVEVGEGTVARDLRIPSPDRSEFVVLRVTGPDGDAVTDYQVATGYRSGSSSSSGGSTVVPRPDGSRWVFHHPLGGMTETEDGVYWVTVTSAKYGILKGEYRKGAAPELALRFEAAGRVEARLAGGEDSGYEGRLSFGLAPSAEKGSTNFHMISGESKIGANGVQAFPTVQPGECVLTLYLRCEHNNVPIARTTVTVKPGKNEFSMAMPTLHAISITGAEGWVMLRKTDDPSYSLHRSAGSEGRVDYDGLPEGEYEVRSGRKTQTIRVPTTVEIRL